LQQVEFVETPLADAVKYLQQRSAELDPAKRGLNIVVDPEVDLSLTTSPALSDVTIGVCLICLAEQVGIDYRRDAHAFLLVPAENGASFGMAQVTRTKVDLRRARPVRGSVSVSHDKSG
jgi:hypothetical protein